jgi:hypothetical protein
MIHLRHIRASQLCTRGARAWFEGHGLSWNDFLTNGIEPAVLIQLDDALANRVIATAMKEADDGRQ